jgi:transketolase
MKPNGIPESKFELGPRRAVYVDARNLPEVQGERGTDEAVAKLEKVDVVYRTLCAILYNFVPQSGHPGGSISSGRIVEALHYFTMEYDMGDPDRPESDLLSYAAGHKAMGLYAAWALRNELARIGKPDLLPAITSQLRFEDLLGFRRNPTTTTPLFVEHKAKPLDGHPTPLTPFVRLATGASGVGVPSSFGLGLGAIDTYRADPPRVHVLEGEGGLTPGRAHEALAAAATAQLSNIVMHLDWNQASIDSNHVCRDGEVPGEYVQWNPIELAYVHDWNVINVPDGTDFRTVLAAQELAAKGVGEQPTVIVYRTTKGWRYGINGRASHGAGHKFCSPEFYEVLKEFEATFRIEFPRFEGEKTPENVEANFFDCLMTIRKALESERELAGYFADRLDVARKRLNLRKREPRGDLPDLAVLYDDSVSVDRVPDKLVLKPGESTTLRAALGNAMNHLNIKTGGGFMISAADLLGSTSVSAGAKGFAPGFYGAKTNPDARLIALGGICEDCMGAFMSGLTTYGHHVGVTSSYGAFIAALQHVAARLHGIGQQAHSEYDKEPFHTFILVCAHAGLKTGEDGPTHADPQPLQLLQENFPANVMITLTPWEPQELWPLLVAGLKARPAILSPFVTRPNETIPDRAALGMPPASAAAQGVYAMRLADTSAKQQNGTIVLQGSGVTNAFVDEVLPRLDEKGFNMNIYYVASAELYNLLSTARQDAIFPETHRRECMGITGFTLPTMYRWVLSVEGRRMSIHPFKKGRYLGSGQAHKVLEEAGLHGEGQWRAVMEYAAWAEKR